ncbi:MAG: glycosyltransferase [Flavobacteriales bacterium]|nr:glycosyltransferase [Flavobacteriales bacterium]
MNKFKNFILKKINGLYLKWLYFNLKKRVNSYDKKINSSKKLTLVVLYYIPKIQIEKYNNWKDGFTQGIHLLGEEDYTIKWINLEDCKPTAQELNQYDFIIVKSCWHWIVDKYIQSLQGLKVPRGIVISCSIPPKSKKWAFFYDVLWFQTFIYKKFIDYHPNTFHAFGIDSETFKPMNIEKDIDVLSIGTVTKYKRFEKLIDLSGEQKIVIGDKTAKDSLEIENMLNKNNIEVIDFVSQEELVKYINRSKLVYIPCELQGGGERAVLEARSCGVKVKVEQDNPKLIQILKNPIWDYRSYAKGIEDGIKHIYSFNENIKTSNLIKPKEKLKVGKYSFHNGNLIIKGNESVSIGSYCSFGKNISIITSNHDTNYPATQGFLYRYSFKSSHPGEVKFPPNKERTKGKVIIGNDVWIGDNVTILSGVNIGNGCCIATGSIVTKNVEPYAVVAGIPAKIIKYRFNQNIIKQLLELQWWYWSQLKIKRNQLFFNCNLNELSENFDLNKIIK